MGDDTSSVGEEPPPEAVVPGSVGVDLSSVGGPPGGDPPDDEPSEDEPPVSEGSVGPGSVPEDPPSESDPPSVVAPPPGPEPPSVPGADTDPSVPSPDGPPGHSTCRATGAPNSSRAPGPGFEPVTGASLGGIPSPATVTARPRSAMAALASPKVIPPTFGTDCRARVSKVVSDSPVVPTSRLMPRSGSSTSTSLISFSCSGAGLTTTTAAWS